LAFKVIAESKVSSLIDAWRKQFNLAKARKVTLYFDGDAVPTNGTMGDVDLDFDDPMETEFLDVQVH